MVEDQNVDDDAVAAFLVMQRLGGGAFKQALRHSITRQGDTFVVLTPSVYRQSQLIQMQAFLQSRVDFSSS